MKNKYIKLKLLEEYIKEDIDKKLIKYKSILETIYLDFENKLINGFSTPFLLELFCLDIKNELSKYVGINDIVTEVFENALQYSKEIKLYIIYQSYKDKIDKYIRDQINNKIIQIMKGTYK